MDLSDYFDLSPGEYMVSIDVTIYPSERATSFDIPVTDIPFVMLSKK
jgi:hypothetical protein